MKYLEAFQEAQLEKPNGFISHKTINRIEEEFNERIRESISTELYETLCGIRKENKRFYYNPIIISKLKRRRIPKGGRKLVITANPLPVAMSSTKNS